MYICIHIGSSKIFTESLFIIYHVYLILVNKQRVILLLNKNKTEKLMNY